MGAYRDIGSGADDGPCQNAPVPKAKNLGGMARSVPVRKDFSTGFMGDQAAGGPPPIGGSPVAVTQTGSGPTNVGSGAYNAPPQQSIEKPAGPALGKYIND